MTKKHNNARRAKCSKNAAALALAKAHFDLEPSITHIFRIAEKPGKEEADSEPIKLLEVNENTVPTGIVPLQFSANETIPYTTVIAEITPAEFDMINSGELEMPKGWIIAEEFARPGKTIGAK